jgi:hypothetical protein
MGKYYISDTRMEVGSENIGRSSFP